MQYNQKMLNVTPVATIPPVVCCLLILKKERQQHDSDGNVKDVTGNTRGEHTHNPQEQDHVNMSFVFVHYHLHWTVDSGEADRKQGGDRGMKCNKGPQLDSNVGHYSYAECASNHLATGSALISAAVEYRRAL